MKVAPPEVVGQAGDVLAFGLHAEDHVQSSHHLNSLIRLEDGQCPVVVLDLLAAVETPTSSGAIECRIDLKLVNGAAHHERSDSGGSCDDGRDKGATTRPATKLWRVAERISN